MWIPLGILSALFLGIYDILKKYSLQENAVLPVLFWSTVFGALMTLPVFIFSRIAPSSMTELSLYAGMPSFREHLFIMAKTVLVTFSWITAYFALKHLPISIVSPIRSSAPLWTLMGAVLLFDESLRPLHWVGITVIFISYYAFSLLGKYEGIAFTKNPYIGLVFAATLTGAASALYDKYLLHGMSIPPVTLQVWFSFYLVAATGLTRLLIHRSPRVSAKKMQWRFTIPLIGIFLIAADFLYFKALSSEDALIAVLSVIRRSAVLVSFVLGGLLFREKNKRKKAIPLLGILAGLILLLMAR